MKTVLNLKSQLQINGVAHITGGGLPDNVVRILPDNCRAVIETSSWQTPVIFSYLQERGGVLTEEMYRVFNMGIGLVIIVPPTDSEKILQSGNGLLDHELTKKLTNLFQEYQPSVIVPALSQQSVEDLALFFLILTRLDAEIYLDEESRILVVDIAAEMFSAFSLDQQAAIAQKITTIDIVSTDQIEKTINGIINQVLDFSQNMVVFGSGTENLARLVAKMNPPNQGQLVESLRSSNPDLATNLNREIMPFNSLGMLDDETIRTLVNYLDANTIAVAIHNLSPEIQNRFINVMDDESVVKLEAKINSLDFAEIQVATSAQQSILDLVHRLSAKGVLQIHRSAGIPDV